jgi:hypothetical protein
MQITVLRLSVSTHCCVPLRPPVVHEPSPKHLSLVMVITTTTTTFLYTE